MTSWDYRIAKKEYISNTGELLETFYFIIEAYYDENNKICMCTQEPEGPAGNTISEMIDCWIMLAEAFNKPVINIDDIPESGAENDVENALQELQDENGNIRCTDDLIAEGKLVVHEMFASSESLTEYRLKEKEIRDEDELRHMVDNVGTPWQKVALDKLKAYFLKQADDSNE